MYKRQLYKFGLKQFGKFRETSYITKEIIGHQNILDFHQNKVRNYFLPKEMAEPVSYTHLDVYKRQHLDGSEKKLEIFVEKYLGTNAVKDRIFTDLLLNQNRKYFELDFINAAHWFLPKDTVEKVGGFNPYFFHYGEDNEYVNRLRYKEKKTFLIKDCFAVHDGKQELGKVDYLSLIHISLPLMAKLFLRCTEVQKSLILKRFVNFGKMKQPKKELNSTSSVSRVLVKK